MLPSDIETAFSAAGLLEKFGKLPPSHQREWIKYIEEAKRPETRARRIEKTVGQLAT